MENRKPNRPLSAMTEQERKRARKKMMRLLDKAREENRRMGLLMSDREVDRYIRMLRGG
jgi:hypothetical protein